MLRPELNESISTGINQITNEMYNEFKLSANSVTNILLSMIFENTTHEQRVKNVRYFVQTAFEKNTKRLVKVESSLKITQN